MIETSAAGELNQMTNKYKELQQAAKKIEKWSN